MHLLDHDGQGATIQLDQRELLMVMALIQEGRESFGCDGHTGRALDQFFCAAVVNVEQARRMDMANNGTFPNMEAANSGLMDAAPEKSH